MLAVEAVGVHKKFGSTYGVKDLNMSVEQGEVFGFIGPNGAGKSTTIRMIMQLLSPSSGELHVLGTSMRQEQPELRRRIGYLPSEIILYPNMTGREMLEFTTRAHGLKVKQTEALQYAERLQWDPGIKIKAYSLGNRKKLGIILALLHQPELLILDEPTSGLDPLVQHEFFQMLGEFNRKWGMTIFFSTHVLSEVEKVCQRVAFIRDGELLRISRMEDLSAGRSHRIMLRLEMPGDQRENDLLKFIDAKVQFDGTYHWFDTGGNPLSNTLAALSRLPIADLTIRRPTIEEMFMDDYRVQHAEEERV